MCSAHTSNRTAPRPIENNVGRLVELQDASASSKGLTNSRLLPSPSLSATPAREIILVQPSAATPKM